MGKLPDDSTKPSSSGFGWSDEEFDFEQNGQRKVAEGLVTHFDGIHIRKLIPFALIYLKDNRNRMNEYNAISNILKGLIRSDNPDVERKEYEDWKPFLKSKQPKVR